MKRMFALIAVGLFVSATAVFTVRAQDDKPMTTKAIMKKLHGGKAAVTKKVVGQLKAADPNWELIAKETKSYEALSAALVKAEPEKGDKTSWDKLAENYAKLGKELHTAAEEKDKPAAEGALKKLGATCKACHGVHKGK